jgi:hypothetical protein
VLAMEEVLRQQAAIRSVCAHTDTSDNQSAADVDGDASDLVEVRAADAIASLSVRCV